MGSLDEFVPEDHLVRQLDEFISWDFIYDICDPLYSDIVAKDGNTDSNDDPHRGDNVFKPAALVFPDHGNAAKAAPFLYDNKMIFPADTRSE